MRWPKTNKLIGSVGIIYFALSASSAFSEAQELKGLSILVNFADSAATNKFDDTTGVKVQDLINEPNVNSLRDYYWDNSGGKMELSTRVLIVDLPKNRGCYDGIGSCIGTKSSLIDRQDAIKSWNPNINSLRDSPDLVGGALFDLENDVLCAIGATCKSASYQEYNSSIGRFEGKTKPFDASEFDSLSKTQSLMSLDWLDIRQFSAGNFFPTATAIPHYSFIQMLLQGEEGEVAGVGTHGEGLWPRAIPRTDTDFLGDNSHRYALGRVGLVVLGKDLNNPKFGNMVHESGHAIFNFKDLYDTQKDTLSFYDIADSKVKYVRDIFDSSVWYKSGGVGDFSLMGGVSNAHSNPPLINAHNRELAGWETPLDLIDAAKSTTTYTLDWQADGSDPRVARSFKYCKPLSSLNECFYIEARNDGANRAYQAPGEYRPIYTSDNGLMIWHAQYYENPADFAANSRKDNLNMSGSALHFDVALMQADGKNHLEKKGGKAGVNDLFRSGGVDYFDGTTSVNSNWWDGTPSGLHIRHISAVGDTMTFRIGSDTSDHKLSPLVMNFSPLQFEVSYFDIEKRGWVRLNSKKNFNVGDQMVLKIRSKRGKAFSVDTSGADEYREFAHRPGSRYVSVKITDKPNIIKISELDSEKHTVKANFQLDQGVMIYYVDDDGSLARAGEETKLNNAIELNIKPTNDVADDSDFEFFAYPKPGFELVSWSLDYHTGSSSDTTWSSSDPKIWIHAPTAIEQASAGFPAIDVRVRTRRIPGDLCSRVQEEWRWDGVYKEVGSLVRYKDSIYSSHVPRASAVYERNGFADAIFAEPGNEVFVAANFSPDSINTPENDNEKWNKVDMCSAVPQDCSLLGLDEWRYGATYKADDQVIHSGKIWKVAKTSSRVGAYGPFQDRSLSVREAIPGAFSDQVMSYTGTIGLNSDPRFDLGSASLSGVPYKFIWALEGVCSQ